MRLSRFARGLTPRTPQGIFANSERQAGLKVRRRVQP